MSPSIILPALLLCLQNCVTLEPGNHLRLCFVDEPQSFPSAKAFCKSLDMELFQLNDEVDKKKLQEFFSESLDEALPSMTWAVDQQLKLPAQ